MAICDRPLNERLITKKPSHHPEGSCKGLEDF